jgi:AraC-like DNA-binding protein
MGELTAETRDVALELALARVPPPNGPIETQLLQAWTLRYQQECRVPVAAAATSVGNRVCAHIETHLCTRLTLQTIAAAVKERPRTIASLFFSAHGMTIPGYVTERRFRTARLLLAGGMKVEAAARLVGLSRKALYRVVRSRTGLTPRALGVAQGR